MVLAGWIGIFLVSLAVLVKASDFFVDSAEKVGIFLGLPGFVVGVLIVGIGTSLPELVSAIIAIFNNSSEIVVGNVLGSNIANIFLVLGIAGIIGKNFVITHDIMKIDIPFLVGSTLLLGLMIIDSVFSLGEAVLCLIALAAYLIGSVILSNPPEAEEKKKKMTNPGISVWIILVLSPVFIFVGATFTIKAVIAISDFLKIGTEVIALSAVALGTSLPEVLVTISAARKGNPEMAVGNIVGSNIFNTLAVMGIPALFSKLSIPSGIISFSLPVAIIATTLYVFITLDKKINRMEGILLLIFYLFFIGKLFNLL